MKDFNENTIVQEMTLSETQEVTGGEWNFKMAVGGAAAGACLGPGGMLLGFIVGGFM